MRLNYRTLGAMALVGALGFASPAFATSTGSAMDLAIEAAAPDNQLQLRELHIDRVSQVTPEGTIHQNLTCWQIMHGNWNGQSLDGLMLVLVRQQGDVNGSAATDRCLYISDSASPAQREALVSALVAAIPATFPDIKSLRIEPASIQIEQLDGTILVLHLARIA